MGYISSKELNKLLKLKDNFQELRINWLLLLAIKFSYKISGSQKKGKHVGLYNFYCL